MTENEISKVVVEAAIEVHRALGGPGLLESLYEEALAYELELRGLTMERQLVVPVVYKGRRLATQLRVDLIVVGRVVVECKAVSTYNRVFEAQVLTYLPALRPGSARRSSCQRRAARQGERRADRVRSEGELAQPRLPPIDPRARHDAPVMITSPPLRPSALASLR